MFGVFYLLFSGFAATADKISRDNRDAESKMRAIQNNNISYYGTRGHRLVSNDRPVYRKRVNGQDVLTDLYTGQVYKNFTKEMRDEAKDEARRQGKTVIIAGNTDRYSDYEKSQFWCKKCHIKAYYRDINTDRLLIPVSVNSVQFYMDLNTGHILRPIDNASYINKDGNLSIEEIITIFNKRQDEVEDLPEYNDWFWRKTQFYLNHIDYTAIIDNDRNIHILDPRSVEYRKLRKELEN